MLTFALAHPFLVCFTICFVASVAGQAWAATVRAVAVEKQGWPTEGSND